MLHPSPHPHPSPHFPSNSPSQNGSSASSPTALPMSTMSSPPSSPSSTCPTLSVRWDGSPGPAPAFFHPPTKPIRTSSHAHEERRPMREEKTQKREEPGQQQPQQQQQQQQTAQPSPSTATSGLSTNGDLHDDGKRDNHTDIAHSPPPPPLNTINSGGGGPGGAFPSKPALPHARSFLLSAQSCIQPSRRLLRYTSTPNDVAAARTVGPYPSASPLRSPIPLTHHVAPVQIQSAYRSPRRLPQSLRYRTTAAGKLQLRTSNLTPLASPRSSPDEPRWGALSPFSQTSAGWQPEEYSELTGGLVADDGEGSVGEDGMDGRAIDPWSELRECPLPERIVRYALIKCMQMFDRAWSSVMNVAVLFSLFGEPIRLGYAPRSLDGMFLMLTLLTFTLFLIEAIIYWVWCYAPPPPATSTQLKTTTTNTPQLEASKGRPSQTNNLATLGQGMMQPTSTSTNPSTHVPTPPLSRWLSVRSLRLSGFFSSTWTFELLLDLASIASLLPDLLSISGFIHVRRGARDMLLLLKAGFLIRLIGMMRGVAIDIITVMYQANWQEELRKKWQTWMKRGMAKVEKFKQNGILRRLSGQAESIQLEEKEGEVEASQLVTPKPAPSQSVNAGTQSGVSPASAATSAFTSPSRTSVLSSASSSSTPPSRIPASTHSAMRTAATLLRAASVGNIQRPTSGIGKDPTSSPSQLSTSPSRRILLYNASRTTSPLSTTDERAGNTPPDSSKYAQLPRRKPDTAGVGGGVMARSSPVPFSPEPSILQPRPAQMHRSPLLLNRPSALQERSSSASSAAVTAASKPLPINKLISLSAMSPLVKQHRLASGIPAIASERKESSPGASPTTSPAASPGASPVGSPRPGARVTRPTLPRAFSISSMSPMISNQRRLALQAGEAARPSPVASSRAMPCAARDHHAPATNRSIFLHAQQPQTQSQTQQQQQQFVQPHPLPQPSPLVLAPQGESPLSRVRSFPAVSIASCAGRSPVPMPMPSSRAITGMAALRHQQQQQKEKQLQAKENKQQVQDQTLQDFSPAFSPRTNLSPPATFDLPKAALPLPLPPPAFTEGPSQHAISDQLSASPASQSTSASTSTSTTTSPTILSVAHEMTPSRTTSPLEIDSVTTADKDQTTPRSVAEQYQTQDQMQPEAGDEAESYEPEWEEVITNAEIETPQPEPSTSKFSHASHIGQLLADYTAHRALIGLLFTLFIFHITHPLHCDTRPALALERIDHHLESATSMNGGSLDAILDASPILQASIHEYERTWADSLLHLRIGNRTVHHDARHIAALRDEEIYRLHTPRCESWISVQARSQQAARFDLFTLLWLVAILPILLCVVYVDVHAVVLPIERMVSFVTSLAKDPLNQDLATVNQALSATTPVSTTTTLIVDVSKELYDRQMKSSEDEGLDGLSGVGLAARSRPYTGTSGTALSDHPQLASSLVELTLQKLALMLQVGFGHAGGEIIAQNIIGDYLDPMIPGSKVFAVFGFCDINDFSRCTEVLEESIMAFVNHIAETVHSLAQHFGGNVNKNIGPSFLLVWKFQTEDMMELKQAMQAYNVSSVSKQKESMDVKDMDSGTVEDGGDRIFDVVPRSRHRPPSSSSPSRDWSRASSLKGNEIVPLSLLRNVSDVTGIRPQSPQRPWPDRSSSHSQRSPQGTLSSSNTPLLTPDTHSPHSPSQLPPLQTSGLLPTSAKLSPPNEEDDKSSEENDDKQPVQNGTDTETALVPPSADGDKREAETDQHPSPPAPPQPSPLTLENLRSHDDVLSEKASAPSTRSRSTRRLSMTNEEEDEDEDEKHAERGGKVEKHMQQVKTVLLPDQTPLQQPNDEMKVHVTSVFSPKIDLSLRPKVAIGEGELQMQKLQPPIMDGKTMTPSQSDTASTTSAASSTTASPLLSSHTRSSSFQPSADRSPSSAAQAPISVSAPMSSHATTALSRLFKLDTSMRQDGQEDESTERSGDSQTSGNMSGMSSIDSSGRDDSSSHRLVNRRLSQPQLSIPPPADRPLHLADAAARGGVGILQQLQRQRLGRAVATGAVKDEAIAQVVKQKEGIIDPLHPRENDAIKSDVTTADDVRSLMNEMIDTIVKKGEKQQTDNHDYAARPPPPQTSRHRSTSSETTLRRSSASFLSSTAVRSAASTPRPEPIPLTRRDSIPTMKRSDSQLSATSAISAPASRRSSRSLPSIHASGTTVHRTVVQALCAFLSTIVKISSCTASECHLDGEVRTRLQQASGFECPSMGFGLHVGWAIEGAIGSSHKIDASYLSPNVNLTARLCSATRQYRVPLILSGPFYRLLDPRIQRRCRHIDQVTLKGSSQPLDLYAFDICTNWELKDTIDADSKSKPSSTPSPTMETSTKDKLEERLGGLVAGLLQTSEAAPTTTAAAVTDSNSTTTSAPSPCSPRSAEQRRAWLNALAAIQFKPPPSLHREHSSTPTHHGSTASAATPASASGDSSRRGSRTTLQTHQPTSGSESTSTSVPSSRRPSATATSMGVRESGVGDADNVSGHSNDTSAGLTTRASGSNISGSASGSMSQTSVAASSTSTSTAGLPPPHSRPPSRRGSGLSTSGHESSSKTSGASSSSSSSSPPFATSSISSSNTNTSSSTPPSHSTISAFHSAVMNEVDALLGELQAGLPTSYIQLFNAAVRYYISGDWQRAGKYLVKFQTMHRQTVAKTRQAVQQLQQQQVNSSKENINVPAAATHGDHSHSQPDPYVDGPSNLLMQFMGTHAFQAPKGWQGYRKLQKK